MKTGDRILFCGGLLSASVIRHLTPQCHSKAGGAAASETELSGIALDLLRKPSGAYAGVGGNDRLAWGGRTIRCPGTAVHNRSRRT
jgi:hypothetical protein